MCADEVVEMRSRMLRETQAFLNLYLNDRAPGARNEPSSPCRINAPHPGPGVPEVDEVPVSLPQTPGTAMSETRAPTGR